MAEAAIAAGRPEKADELYRGLMKASPGPTPAANLSVVLLGQSRFAEAEALLRAELQPFPDDPLLRWNLAFALLRRGAYAEAWPHYEQRRARLNWNQKLSF